MRKAEQYFNTLKKLESEGLKLKMPIDKCFLRLPILIALDIIGEMIYKKMNDEEMEAYEKQVVPFLNYAWNAIF